MLEAAYADWHWDVAWQYGPEAITYRLSARCGEIRFLKIAPPDAYPSLENEAERMRWAIDHLPVPPVLESGSNADVSWLVTTALSGSDAVDPRWTADPARLVRALAEGLRTFHEAPVDNCPFDFGLDSAIAHARKRLEAGQIQPARDFHPEFEHLSAEQALELLARTRPELDQLAVCHGDYCLPNVLVQEHVATGFVDLGELGLADRWSDLAVATWSVTWNLGPGYEELFLSAYGVEREDERIDFYRLLYDVVS